ncbi:AN1-type zinc finger protein 2A-like [Hetaerina americana]|uniref:AN1-type zinc finger protein 2A-like n=1 Tax=Hetaerina americana TaxID=62018 RepID=UPI003A7F1143
MEFPHLGKHCHLGNCKKLDFLPMKCDACENIFCQDHFTYNNHNCPSASQKDVQVPVCPLCNIPIPTKRGQLPDIAVGAHIDSDCQSDPAQSRRKVFTNRCNVKACKQKELIPVLCRDCKLNYCLKHRHPQDHQCKGSPGSNLSKAGEAAIFRTAKQASGPSTSKSPRNIRPAPPLSAIQGQMSEDEALSRALAASLAEDKMKAPEPRGLTLEEEDEMLARAIAESEQEQEVRSRQVQPPPQSSLKERCAVS